MPLERLSPGLCDCLVLFAHASADAYRAHNVLTTPAACL